MVRIGETQSWANGIIKLNKPTRGLLLRFNNLIIFLKNQSLHMSSDDIDWGKRH